MGHVAKSEGMEPAETKAFEGFRKHLAGFRKPERIEDVRVPASPVLQKTTYF